MGLKFDTPNPESLIKNLANLFQLSFLEMSARKKYATAIAIATKVYVSKIAIESSIEGTEVELLIKPRIVVKLSGSLGKAY